MKTIKAVILTLAAASAGYLFADPIDFTTPLVFSGGTEITESSDSGWNTLQPLTVNVTGEGNVLIGNSGESNPWRLVNLSGDGYLTMERNAQWSIGFNGGSVTNFYGTLHIRQIANGWVYFGIGKADLSLANASVAIEPSESATDMPIIFTNGQGESRIGDFSTAGQFGSKVRVRSKNGGSTLRVGYLNKNSVFDGTFEPEDNGSRVTNLDKVGAGTWTVNGNIRYNGTFSVSEGAAVLNGSVSSAVTVASGARLGGTGTLSGAVSATSGAALAFTETEALTFTGAADLTGFGLDTASLDTTKTYTVAKGTASLPTLTLAQQEAGWMVLSQNGDVVLKNSAQSVTENMMLAEDTDWSESFTAIAAGVQIDLNGHELKLAGVTLGNGASIVNTASGKANLVVGCNGGDKSFAFDTDFGSNIMVVFTGAAVDLNGYTSAGGIAFADTDGVQYLDFASFANGVTLLGNAKIAEAPDDDAWGVEQPIFDVFVYGDGNVLQGCDKTSAAWHKVRFHGDGYLKLSRPAKWEFLTSDSDMTDFYGTLHFVQDTSTEFYSRATGIGTYTNTTLVFEPSASPSEWYVRFSSDWGNADRHVGDLQMAGDYASHVKLGLRAGAGALYVGSANKSSTFTGNLLVTDRVYDLIKEGTGTWTLTGTVSNGAALGVVGGTLALNGATIGNVTAVNVNGGTLSGTSEIPAEVPVSFANGSAVSGALTFKSQPATAGTVSFIPAFTGTTAQILTFDCENPTLAGFTLEADEIPVVPVGTEFVIAEGPANSTIVAPTLGTSAEDAGWTVKSVGNQVILTSTKQPPLEISGEFTLDQDYDYSTGSIVVEAGSVIDLNGHTLRVGAITLNGAVAFTNSAADKANLEAGYNEQSKAWLWGEGVTLAAGVRAVIVGAAVEIPDSFVPAGGIGFKDTVETQYVKPSACANGLAFLGNANLREGDNSWNKVKQNFPVLVEGKGNVFTFDHVVESWESTEEFTTTPFSGSGELMLCGTNNVAGYIGIGNNGVDNRSFTGKITINTPEGRTRNAAVNDDSNAVDRGFRNATIALCNDEERDVVAIVNSGNYNSAIYCNLGSLVTEGEHPERISIVPIRPAGGAHLIVGRDGRGEGIFAGTFTNYNGETAVNYDIEKHGTGVWTLTGTVGNGGAFSVAEGEVAFSNGVANVSSLSVANGAKALLSGAVNTSPAFTSGSTLVLAADNNAVPVINGDLNITGVTVEVRMGSFKGDRTRELLRVRGTITGFDLANVNMIKGPEFEFDDDPKKYTFEITEDGNGDTVLKYRLKLGFSVIIR